MIMWLTWPFIIIIVGWTELLHTPFSKPWNVLFSCVYFAVYICLAVIVLYRYCLRHHSAWSFSFLGAIFLCILCVLQQLYSRQNGKFRWHSVEYLLACCSYCHGFLSALNINYLKCAYLPCRKLLCNYQLLQYMG